VLNPAAGRADWRGAAAVVRDGLRWDDAVLYHAPHVNTPFRYYIPDLPVAERPLRFPARCRVDLPTPRPTRLWLVMGHVSAESRGAARQCVTSQGYLAGSDWWFPQEGGVEVVLFESQDAPRGATR
jgi:hypothetical protein